MSPRDRVVIGLLSLVLVILVGVIAAPSLTPTVPDATPGVSFAPTRPYIEGVVGSATSVSPFSARTPAERAIVALVFRGLVRPGPGDSFVGDLAESWEVDPTGSIWTFRLREGLAWHDGQPLTASDVVFTIGALSDPEYSGPGAESWREVSASAPAERTVILTLLTPLGGFLMAAAQPIAPAHLLGGFAPADLPSASFGQHPVGSGSFRVAMMDQTRVQLAPAITEVAEPDGGIPESTILRPTDSLSTAQPTVPGGAPQPYLDGIEFRFFADPAALMDAWRAGDLDGASGLPPADVAALGALPGSRVLRYPTATLFAVTLNLRATHPEFRDQTVRLALLQAIDRDAIVRDVLAGFGARADGPIPPTSWAFDPALSPPVAHDPAAARAALAAAGWKEAADGGWFPKGATDVLTIELLSPEEAANPAAFAVAAAVAADWRGIGLTVVMTPLPSVELVGGRLRGGAFSAAVLGLGIGLDADLYPLLASTQATTTGSNFAGLQDPALDRLLAAARAPGTLEARTAAYRALQERLATGQFLLPIAFRDEAVVVRDTLSGVEIRPIGSPGDRFWDVLTWRLAGGR